MKLLFDKGTLILKEVPASLPIPPEFIFDNRVDKYRTQGYRYRWVVEYFKKNRISFEDWVPAYQKLQLTRRLQFDPHPFQREAIEAWKANKFLGIIELPTGAGKSYVAQMAIELTQRSTLVVVPTLDLMNQWYDLLGAAFGGNQVGLLGGGYYELNSLTVTTYDSATNHMERMGHRWGLIIFDECHHLPGPMYAHAAEMCIAPYRLALTATLERADGRHVLLEDLVGPVVYRKGIKDLAGAYLSDYEVKKITVHLSSEEQVEYTTARKEIDSFVREHGLSLSSIEGWKQFIIHSSRTPEGRRAMLAYQTSRKISMGTSSKLRALESLLKQHARDRVIIFTADNETVYTISQTFLIPAITHQTDTKERKAILEAFNRGDYSVLVTSKVLNEGVNVPEANVAIILSGSGSVREHVQRLGRILRRREGKHATLYEVVTKGTVEERISQRRSKHDAYQ
ncbi:MAG TPA: DEAD/DEAH box helicase family protein [Candidatus Limnocylindrales bacterium]|nr:DEAD/DEAH box helicase family protein [Candidatus Limnocylindrales bacterium]